MSWRDTALRLCTRILERNGYCVLGPGFLGLAVGGCYVTGPVTEMQVIPHPGAGRLMQLISLNGSIMDVRRGGEDEDIGLEPYDVTKSPGLRDLPPFKEE